MAQQKSEDRVVPEGGVMPAERVGSSSGGRRSRLPHSAGARVSDRIVETMIATVSVIANCR